MNEIIAFAREFGILAVIALMLVYMTWQARGTDNKIRDMRETLAAENQRRLNKIAEDEANERRKLFERLNIEIDEHSETRDRLGTLQLSHRELSDQHATTVKAFDGFRAQAADKEQIALKRITDLEADKRSMSERLNVQASEIENLKSSIAALKKQIGEEQEANRRLVAVNSELQDEKQTLLFQLNDVTIDRNRLKEENGALEKRISTLEEQIKALQEDGKAKELEISTLRTELNALMERQTALIISTGELPAAKTEEIKTDGTESSG